MGVVKRITPGKGSQPGSAAELPQEETVRNLSDSNTEIEDRHGITADNR